MQTTYKIKLQELDTAFIQKLQSLFKKATLEITIHPEQATKTATTTLDTTKFWQLIQTLDWSKMGDDEAIVEPVIQQLSQLTVADIYQFEELLAQLLYQLDGQVFAENIGEGAYQKERYFSVDNFLYARCCVVANGQAFYEQVAQNPSLMPKDLTFEPLLYIGEKAYKRKTKRDDFLPVTDCSYESYSNVAAWPTLQK